jgi:transglutaminase-like putative cysteine protease
MTFRATHVTTYTYTDPVSLCHNEVHLHPRATARQSVQRSELKVEPTPNYVHSHKDYFGNSVSYFAIHGAHTKLVVTAESIVDVHPYEPPIDGLTPSWEVVRDEVSLHESADTLDAFQYLFESPYVKTGPAFAAFAQPSFTANRNFLDAVKDLCHRIFKEFKYDREATSIATPVGEVLLTRHGVCQDFAHVMIGCLRSLRLPARYVSGYLRSGPKMIGAEASHAWVSAYCSGFGWLDFDPTNDVLPSGNHLTVAWGRDYSDVSPVKGVAVGGGEQTIDVAVSVVPTIE